MATQSLYRRYRPRRFSEVKGQDHVVRALRNAVAEGREGQAYLFSGPRGTGKTTSARILAKVLNCEQPTDGEPCCECESCRSVERGTSYDVHELDAASNNGVDSMRDLIEKASLGTPGRHKVYILDEVHMLSKGAEATLLKTLEEPPPHVVFVLATTDPQRVSDTIRSRTQHLQFHLLPTDTLAEHVRWVVADAGLTVDDDAIGDVLALGGGSARDTLSALELVASAGGERVETVSYDEFVEAMIDRDPGRALTMVAQAVSLGRDPRTLTEELVGFLRNGFLALMAPELVQLPSDRVEVVADLARRLGPPGLVRGIEVFGTALVEMRQAPEPRVLLEVAVVQLTADSVAVDVTALLTRLDRLERRVDELGRHGEPTAATETGSAAETGPPAARAALGGRARSRPAPSTQPDAGPTTASEAVGSRDHTGTAPAPDGAPERAGPSEAEPATADSDASADSGSAGGPLTRDDWENTIRPQLRGMARAVYAPAEFVSSSDTNVVLSLPDNPMHLKKCEQQRSTVESALAAHTGSAVAVEFVTGDGDGGGGDGDAGGGGDAGDAGSGDDADGGGGDGGGVASRAMSDGAAISTATPRGAEGARAAPDGSPVDEAPAGRSPTGRTQDQVGGDVAARGPDVTGSTADSTAGPTADSPGAPIRALPEDHEVDLDDLVEAPPESVKTPIDRLAEAFPGSQFIDESA